MRIAIIGRTQWLYDLTTALLKAGHEIALIATARAAPEYTKDENDFKELANQIGCEFHLGRDLRPIVNKIKGFDIAVSINWVGLITEEIIDCFRIGVLNAHLGDLPKYRGNACPNWAILNEEKKIGLSFHLMRGDDIDCGPIINKLFLKIDQSTEINDVYKWASEAIPSGMVTAVNLLQASPNYSLADVPPDSEDGFYCFPRQFEDGFVDWSASARSINALVRASGHPFPGAYCYVVEADTIRRLFILKSRYIENTAKYYSVPGQVLRLCIKSGEAYVACGNGELVLGRCRYGDENISFSPGKRWKNRRKRLGVRAEEMAWYFLKNSGQAL